MTKNFVVALLFDEHLNDVVLVRRAREPFAGRHNGPGGEVEEEETPLRATFREIREETGLTADNLTTFPDGRKLLWLGTLAIPRNRKYPEIRGDEADPPAKLHYYAGMMTPDARPRTMEERNVVLRFNVYDVTHHTPNHPWLAGNGNLEYFVREAISRLTENQKGGDPS